MGSDLCGSFVAFFLLSAGFFGPDVVARWNAAAFDPTQGVKSGVIYAGYSLAVMTILYCARHFTRSR